MRLNCNLRPHLATVLVVLLVAFIVFAGPGSGGGSGPVVVECDNEDIGLYLSAAYMGCVTGPIEEYCNCKYTRFFSPGREDGATGPMHFERNLGQVDGPFSAISRSARGYAVYLSSATAVVELKTENRDTATVRAIFEGARPNAAPEPEEPLDGRINYFLGEDPKHWITDVPTFRRVRYRNVYPGVDLVFYGNGANLEHDFVVSPGANPDAVTIRFDGAESAALDSNGDLVLRARGEELRWKKPILYQTADCGARKPVEGRYRKLAGGRIGFEVGAYDPKRHLVIDPEVLFSSFLGRQGWEFATRTAVDSSGNVYVTGGSMDPAFPVTAGAFQTSPGARDRNNVFVSKFRSDGTSLVYSTYIGGQRSDIGAGIAVDSAGNVYVAGLTTSDNFPVTTNAFRRSSGNPGAEELQAGDCFVSKLNAAGNALTYSTYLGGRAFDSCSAIALDPAGNAYLAGVTTSTDFPASEGALQTQYRTGYSSRATDAFLAKLNPAGSALVFGTYFGGNGFDTPSSIAVDSSGNSWIAGATNSTSGFPTTENAFQRTYKQDGPLLDRTRNDAFVVKFNPAGTGLLYGTYLGGGHDDAVFGLAVDAAGAAYLCGNTQSTDFPVTADAFQRSFAGTGGQGASFLASGDAFVAKLNPAGTALTYATYLGGERDDRALACAVDAAGNLHVTGYTLSTAFPVTTDARQRTFSGLNQQRRAKTGDAFYSKLDSRGQRLTYSTYHGGNDEDMGAGIALDSNGIAIIAGSTSSVNLFASPSAAQRAFGGGPPTQRTDFPFGDAFVLKIGDPPPPPKPVPAISSVVSAASFAGGSVAPGELLVIGGANLAAADPLSAPEGASLPLRLGLTRVLFDGAEAPLVAVSPSRITVIAPFAIAANPETQIVVDFDGQRSAAVRLPVVAAKPALFTVSADGRGPAAVTNEDNTANSAENPAPQGTIVTIFGTGAGVTEPPSVDGQIATEHWPPLAAPVSITIGDRAVDEIFFSGGVAGRPAGVFQVQFRLPPDLPAGDLPIVVRVGDAETQTGVTIAIREPI